MTHRILDPFQNTYCEGGGCFRCGPASPFSVCLAKLLVENVNAVFILGQIIRRHIIIRFSFRGLANDSNEDEFKVQKEKSVAYFKEISFIASLCFFKCVCVC